jgi:type II secretory pathway pseudopilin PulG
MKNFAARVGSRIRDSRDAGFTLVELLVASMLAVMVGGIILTTLLAAQRSADATLAGADLNGEARDLLNRLSGDLRQATPLLLTDPNTGAVTETPAVLEVQNPYDPALATVPPPAVTSITFDADFSGDNCIGGVVSDGCSPAPTFNPDNPETETVCWNPANELVYLIAGGVQAGSCNPTTPGVSPQTWLSGKVTALKLECNSNNYLYDSNYDGVTTWRELDAQGPPIGNKNGMLDGNELKYINSFGITVTVEEDGHSATFNTLVSVRNVS